MNELHPAQRDLARGLAALGQAWRADLYAAHAAGRLGPDSTPAILEACARFVAAMREEFASAIDDRIYGALLECLAHGLYRELRLGTVPRVELRRLADRIRRDRAGPAP